MYSVLVGELDDLVFGSCESDEVSVQVWVLCIVEQLCEVGKCLSELLWLLQGEVVEQVWCLLECLLVLFECLLLLVWQVVGGLLIRVYGDLYLGQVLMVQGDVCFIDFEGELVCSLEECCQCYSLMKDVGGMLCLFDYVVVMVLCNVQSIDSLEQVDSVWCKVVMCYCSEVCDVFLVGYWVVVVGFMYVWYGCEGEGVVLVLVCLEKVVYELFYEVDYCFDWLEVFFVGLVEFIEYFLKGKN